VGLNTASALEFTKLDDGLKNKDQSLDQKFIFFVQSEQSETLRVKFLQNFTAIVLQILLQRHMTVDKKVYGARGYLLLSRLKHDLPNEAKFEKLGWVFADHKIGRLAQIVNDNFLLL